MKKKEDSQTDKEDLDEFARLSESTGQIVRGDYEASGVLFAFESAESTRPDVRDLAENLGLMSVKIESREYALEQALDTLREKNAELENNIALRAESGFLLCSILALVSTHAIVVSAMESAGLLNSASERFLTFSVMIALVIFGRAYLARHKYPLAMWGLTWRNAMPALRDGLLFSIPLALAGIGVRWLMVNQPGSPLYGQSLFTTLDPFYYVALYVFFSFVQELISRGFLQSCLECVMIGKRRTVIAILTSSVSFAMAHLHYGTQSVVITFLAGLYFGWLYTRHRTLVGVTVAHFLLGVLYIDVLELVR